MWGDLFWLDLVDIFATQSHCKKKQVAAIFVKDNHIIATGVNGTIKGDSNCCEDSEGKTEHWRVIHAEMNGIANARDINDIQGSTLYINYFPCENCAKHLVQFGVQKIIFRGLVKEPMVLLHCKKFIDVKEITC
jgi:dCMP deaminase